MPLFCFLRVKSDHLKMSLDNLAANDTEMASNVIGSADMIRDVFIYADKCGTRELTKVTEEY